MPKKTQRERPQKPSPALRERGDPSRRQPKPAGLARVGRVGEDLTTDSTQSPSPGSLRSPPSPAPAPTLPSPAIPGSSPGRGGLGRGRERGEGAATRCGYVALIGAPNAGKSTLLNQLVGKKLAIVTPKVQTTRTRLLGIAIVGEAQLILVDTPGIFEPRRRLDRAMVAAAWAGAADADETVLLVDAARPADPDTRRIIERLAASGRRAILALNKVDLVRRDSLLAMADTLFRAGGFDHVFMISGLTGDGVEDLKQHLASAMPPGPWLFPEDQLSDAPERWLAAEVTREQVFLQLHDELPYAAAVETEAWQERADGSVKIDQVIYVRRAGQKAIVLGDKGTRIKAIGSRARAELAGMLERPVHLFLFVKVRENWIEDPERYAALGLDYNV
jgi:GTP-binding protein Era